MKKLRLGFTDTIEPFAEFFIETLGVEYEIERDDANPDYLIFGDRNFGQNNLNYNNKNCVKIFYTGENQRPWDYSCHYAITFDHYDTSNHYRLPLYVIYDWDNKRKGVANIETRSKAKHKHEFIKNFNERKFCSFIVKNPGCEMRNNFFHKLSQYKQVDSAGPLFNNTGIKLDHGANAVQEKLAFLPKYKFNLCFENASHPGYATEKIYEALVAGTIPIYWGSPTIALDFNTDTFLSWHDYQDDDKFIDAIKEVDDDYRGYRHFLYMTEEYMVSRFNKALDLDRFRFWFGKNVYRGVIN
jgi:hypothetical protein